MPAAHTAGGPRRWGFHRLDARWARAIVCASGARRGDLVLDVGAGHGALTRALAATGATVVAIELHPGRCDALRARFADVANVRVVRADATDLRLPRRPFRVVANPPFAATTALLKRLTAKGSRLERADLVLPRTIARRWEHAGLDGYDVALVRGLPRAATIPQATMDLAVLVVAHPSLPRSGSTAGGIAAGSRPRTERGCG